MGNKNLYQALRLFERMEFDESSGDEDPVFILAGNVPDYRHRLPDDWKVCVPLGSHGGTRVMLYRPRGFDIDTHNGEIRIHDGTLFDDENGDTEFTITVPFGDIITGRLLNRAGYVGDDFETIFRE